MGRIYTVSFSEVAVAAQQDFFELVAPSTGAVLLHQLELSQSSLVGDAQEEVWALLLKEGSTTSGSGGSTPTAIPNNFGDTAFGGSAEANNTTKASAGTIVTHAAWAWNTRAEFIRVWTPETRPILRPSRRLTVELATTPAGSTNVSGVLTFESIG